MPSKNSNKGRSETAEADPPPPLKGLLGLGIFLTLSLVAYMSCGCKNSRQLIALKN